VIPTRRLVALAALPLSLGVAAAWLPQLVWVVAGVDAVLLAVALVDALLARGSVQVGREVPAVQAVGREFEVSVAVANVGRRSLRLRLTDDAPGRVTGLPVQISLPEATRAHLDYRLRIDGRGEHRFGPITVRWASPLGLWDRQRAFEEPSSVRVYPNFAQLRRHGLKARADEQRIPVRVRRRPGGENEFERLRPYVPGDSYRHIDWKATARRREFITREYGQESNQNVLFLLDAGRMMSARSGHLTAFDHALNAALMMGQTALRHGDRVGLLVFDDRVRAWLPPRGGARTGSHLIRATYDVFPSLREPDYALAFRYLAQRVRRRSLVVLLTSVVDEVNSELSTALVGAMAGRHLPICVWMRDLDVDELLHRDATSAPERYVRCAAAELSAWRERSLAGLQRRGALVVDCAPQDLTTRLLSRYLEIKARRLL